MQAARTTVLTGFFFQISAALTDEQKLALELSRDGDRNGTQDVVRRKLRSLLRMSAVESDREMVALLSRPDMTLFAIVRHPFRRQVNYL